jgi:cob(I)alamin adenosyltransferase
VRRLWGLFYQEPDGEDRELAQFGMTEALDFIRNFGCDLLILDEIGNALRYNLVTVEQVKSLIKEKPEKMELVLTGRGIPDEILELADMVTETKEIKHPYKKGITSRRGIEY